MTDLGKRLQRLSGLEYRLRRRLAGPVINGPRGRLRVGVNVGLSDVLINTSGGSVDIGDCVFFGHDVLLLTGTHDYRLQGLARQRILDTTARSIHIGAGVWIASRVVVIGPCQIGANSVIGCGCVIDFDVPANMIVRLSQDVSKREIRYTGVDNGD